MSKMDWAQVSDELQKPLNPDAIKPPPQGKFGEYVDALHVIREANRIFGHDGWSYEVTRLEQTHSHVLKLKGQNGEYEQMRCSFLCSVRVVVDGVAREGTAVGIGNGNPNSAGDVIESAVKEAETDALKRAMRTFGNTFGLALYEKDKGAREVGYSASQSEVEAAVKHINAMETIDTLKAYYIGLSKDMKHIAQHADVVKAKDARKAAIEKAGQ